MIGTLGKSISSQLALLVRGDAAEILVYPKVPWLRSGSSRTVVGARLTFKDKISDTDPTANAAFSADGGQLSITSTNSVGIGQVLNVVSPELRFDLTAVNTALLTALRTYYFDCQITMNDGALYTVESGLAEFGQAVTLATS